MLIQPFSDLHLEFEPFQVLPSPAEVIVLAGDTSPKGRGVDFAKTLDKPVIYVAGNHEFYGDAYPKHLTKLKTRAADSNVHVLENEALVLNGVRFLGCTLWTDFALYGRETRLEAMRTAEAVMNDYKCIRFTPGYRRLNSLDVLRAHEASVTWLQEQLLEVRFEGPTVVVTHHLPSLTSIHPCHAGDATNPAYASDLDALLQACPANITWIHGHSHFAQDYRIGSVRIIANPRGYPFEELHGFDARKVIEV